MSGSKMELQPGNEWASCLCAEIDPRDLPCIVCEVWIRSGETPPPEVGALFGKVPGQVSKENGMYTRTVEIFGGMRLLEGVDYHWAGDYLCVYMDEPESTKVKARWWEPWRRVWPKWEVVPDAFVVHHHLDGKLIESFYGWAETIYCGYTAVGAQRGYGAVGTQKESEG